ncbi:MAG: tRNA (adenosine(37)-N6)-threonylcarbamoyltransferase complex ATPase subunit type 1 TsaE [Candidatus Eisenbacteria bacterium]|uniref:tRNA threonylcarbamoyladenosine biosynthesis protein TsaE n=1 Tax=Eiseniibacteriota bacterium TaxID=2212470 RepID=A0A538U3Z7_UNCEI|nr:MAG: tRNA (adenosine(37)-N6)-threonylcarbamoyltransferase complex ATPase subunit type 1 TsaE [Candidatus Eisenbacteria bacterium]
MSAVDGLRRSDAAAETESFGAALAPALAIGDVLTLHGPLGSGKTCFVTGLARGLGVRGRVRSPSFGLIHEMSGRLPLAHVDLYRLAEREAEGLGLEELCERAVLVVEWGEKLPSALRQDALAIEFRMLGTDSRQICACARGERGVALWNAWREIETPRRPA